MLDLSCAQILAIGLIALWPPPLGWGHECIITPAFPAILMIFQLRSSETAWNSLKTSAFVPPLQSLGFGIDCLIGDTYCPGITAEASCGCRGEWNDHYSRYIVAFRRCRPPSMMYTECPKHRLLITAAVEESLPVWIPQTQATSMSARFTSML